MGRPSVSDWSSLPKIQQVAAVADTNFTHVDTNIFLMSAAFNFLSLKKHNEGVTKSMTCFRKIYVYGLYTSKEQLALTSTGRCCNCENHAEKFVVMMRSCGTVKLRWLDENNLYYYRMLFWYSLLQ